MRIFITGASGFVGGAAVRALKGAHDIRAMSRSQGSDAKIAALGVAPVRCSLDDVAAEHLAGCDTVIHAAAHVEAWGPWADYWRFNVDGTKRMLAAAKEAGVKRFIHIGTEAALFYGQAMHEVDETYPLALHSPFPYSRTKAHAERAVRQANDPGAGFTTIVLRPRMIWGPGDQTILKEVAAVAKAGRFAWVDGGRALTSTTHIANLVHGIEQALTKGRGGEAYFVLDGSPARMRDFMTAYLATAGIDLSDKSVPGWLLRGAAAVIEPIWRILGIKAPPPITRFVAAIMSRDCVLKDDKARAELGYNPPLSREAGLAQLVHP